MYDVNKEQDATSRIYGLAFALKEVCFLMKRMNPDMPVGQIKALRDHLIEEFKKADLPENFHLQHAEVVRPATEAIEAAFGPIIRDWGEDEQ